MVSHNRPVLPLSMVVTETDKTFVEHIIRTEPNATRMATTFYFQHERNKQPNPRPPMPQSSTIHTPSGHLKSITPHSQCHVIAL